MFRFFFFVLSFFFFSNSLNAQTDNAATTGRLTTQQISPAEAILQKETSEVDGFARKLASLKTAFADHDASLIVAYETYLMSAMRQETDQMAAKSNAARLEKMTSIMAAFEAHAFNTADPEAAARDFAKLDEFLKIMQEELKQ